jgi:hypothetical protein
MSEDSADAIAAMELSVEYLNNYVDKNGFEKKMVISLLGLSYLRLYRLYEYIGQSDMAEYWINKAMQVDASYPQDLEMSDAEKIKLLIYFIRDLERMNGTPAWIKTEEKPLDKTSLEYLDELFARQEGKADTQEKPVESPTPTNPPH